MPAPSIVMPPTVTGPGAVAVRALRGGGAWRRVPVRPVVGAESPPAPAVVVSGPPAGAAVPLPERHAHTATATAAVPANPAQSRRDRIAPSVAGAVEGRKAAAGIVLVRCTRGT